MGRKSSKADYCNWCLAKFSF